MEPVAVIGSDAVHKDALLSPCGAYRYWLKRSWDINATALPIIMLNPSTADADIDDPTIRRCMTFARREGYGGVFVVNLFAFRATDPSELLRAADPVGPANDHWLTQAIAQARGDILCAWGANGGEQGRESGATMWRRREVSRANSAGPSAPSALRSI